MPEALKFIERPDETPPPLLSIDRWRSSCSYNKSSISILQTDDVLAAVNKVAGKDMFEFLDAALLRDTEVRFPVDDDDDNVDE